MDNKKIALITGVQGMDGSFLAEPFIKQRLHCSWYYKNEI